MSDKLVTIIKNTIINLSKLKEYSFDNRYLCNRNGIVYLIKEELPGSYKCSIMSPFITKDGYVEYVLTAKDGKKKHIQAHRIVAGLYLKPIAGKEYVNHKDGNKQNNADTNLQYATRKENIQHTYDKLGRTAWNKGNKK